MPMIDLIGFQSW